MKSLGLSSGTRFGRLVVVSSAHSKGGKASFLVKCDCGEERIVPGRILRKGLQVSCGCAKGDQMRKNRIETVHHGAARRGKKSAEYLAWIGMKRRCQSPRASFYAEYGGRGIRVCARWAASFEAFKHDMGPKPTRRHSIDRIDVNGNYEPGNCRWATPKEQARNTRRNIHITSRGVTLTLAEWAGRLGLNYSRLVHRLRRGTPRDAVLDLPSGLQWRRIANAVETLAKWSKP